MHQLVECPPRLNTTSNEFTNKTLCHRPAVKYCGDNKRYWWVMDTSHIYKSHFNHAKCVTEEECKRREREEWRGGVEGVREVDVCAEGKQES
jgi:hypothetical protein